MNMHLYYCSFRCHWPGHLTYTAYAKRQRAAELLLCRSLPLRISRRWLETTTLSKSCSKYLARQSQL